MNEIIIGDFAWLRNDYISDEDELLIDGISYPSVEHAFQAAKFSDRHIKVCIADAETVEEARIISRRTPGVRSDWDQVRDRVMESLIRQKFIQSNFLATKLARTGSSK